MKQRLKRAWICLTAFLVLCVALLPGAAALAEGEDDVQQTEGETYVSGDGEETYSEDAEAFYDEYDADAETAEAVTVSGVPAEPSGLNLSNVVNLGKVPDETKVEQTCEVLYVIDMKTGVPIHDKGATSRVAVEDAAVQLLTALTALDYVSLDEVIPVNEGNLLYIRGSASQLRLNKYMQVCVSDLIASMLMIGAVDSAYTLVKTVEERAGESIGVLMQRKAESLGMNDTDYTGCDGIGMTPITTSVIDQARLYLSALKTEELKDIFASGVWQIRSRDAEWVTEQTEGYKSILAANARLPKTIQSPVSEVNPSTQSYDARISSLIAADLKGSFSNKVEKSITFAHAKDYRGEIAVLLWGTPNKNAESEKRISKLTDIFTRRKIVDLLPHVEAAATSVSVTKNSVTTAGWSLVPGYSLYGRQMAKYDPDDEAPKTSEEYDLRNLGILLKPEVASMRTYQDGSRTVSVMVLVNNEAADNALLKTQPKKAQTTVSEGFDTLYSEEDFQPVDSSLTSRFNIYLIIGIVAIAAIVLIVIGLLIRNRLERW